MLSEAAFHDFDYLTVDFDIENNMHFTFITHLTNGSETSEWWCSFFVTLKLCCWFLQIAARPGSQHFKCLYRVAFVPRDAYDLLTADPNAFEYFYMQVSTQSYANVNDIATKASESLLCILFTTVFEDRFVLNVSNIHKWTTNTFGNGKNTQINCIFTDHVHSRRKDNVFTDVCLSIVRRVRGGGGGGESVYIGPVWQLEKLQHAETTLTRPPPPPPQRPWLVEPSFPQTKNCWRALPPLPRP